MVGALSPEWVAHTNNKIKHCEIPTKCEEELHKEELELMKKSICESISLLRNDGAQLSSLSFDNGTLNMSMDVAIEQLL